MIRSARETVVDVAQPLVDLLARYTGTCVTMVLGAPPPEGERRFFLKGIHSGTTTSTDGTPGKRWHHHDPDGFQACLKIFSQFLLKTDRKYIINYIDFSRLTSSSCVEIPRRLSQ